MYEYTRRIRDLINAPRKQHLLLKNRPLWFQLCSSLDVVGDSDLALQAYTVKKFEQKNDKGELYLSVYGLLQALFMQQDAVMNMAEALGLPETIKNYPMLEMIRDIRNDSVGHPTKRDKKKGEVTSYHFISRITLGPHGFELLSNYADGRHGFRNIRIRELMSEQETYVAEILKNTITALEDEEQDHREKFRMEKLAACFPQSLSYYFQKVFEATGNVQEPGSLSAGAAGLSVIKDALAEFREALGRRGTELAAYNLDYVYEEIGYPLGELEAFLDRALRREALNINERTAYIFAFFLEKKLAGLRQTAEELDDEYAA